MMEHTFYGFLSMKFGHYALLFLLLCAMPARAENAVTSDDIDSRMAGKSPVGRDDPPVRPPVAQRQFVVQETQAIPSIQDPAWSPGALYIETVPRPGQQVNLPAPRIDVRSYSQPLMRAAVLQQAPDLRSAAALAAQPPVQHPPVMMAAIPLVPPHPMAATPAPVMAAMPHPGDEWIAPGAEHVPLPEPLPSAHMESHRPMIAIVIDDMGVDRKKSARALMLPPPVTMSYLPYSPDIADQIAAAKKERHELLVHMPMQPDRATADPGPNYLGTDMSPLALHDRVVKNLSAFTGYIGVNNHMGSKFTCDREGLDVVMTVLAEHKLMFLDSRTSPDSVAEDAARKHHLLAAHRDVFLDNDESPAAVQKEIAHMENVARHAGTVIAIGHPKHVTLTALELWVPTLKDKGFDLVPLSKVIEIRNAGRTDVAAAEAKAAATLVPAAGLQPAERAVEVSAVAAVPPKVELTPPPAKPEPQRRATTLHD